MEVTQHSFAARDGVRLVWREAGAGRPLILLHGLFSDAQMNWIKWGTAQTLADAGHRLIMLDLRAHGLSDKPHDPAAYRPGVLAEDVADLVAELGLAPGGFDLAGFSLGARTAVRAVMDGVAPRRLTLAGMGYEGLTGWARRREFFLRAIDRFETVKRGDPEFMAVGFMKTMQVDRVAARLLLEALDDIDVHQLAARVTMPTLVLSGTEDRDNGSPERLAESLPDAELGWVPGTHMTSVMEAGLGAAMVAFLGGG